MVQYNTKYTTYSFVSIHPSQAWTYFLIYIMNELNFKQLPYLGYFDDCKSILVRALIIAGNTVQFTHIQVDAKKNNFLTDLN